MFELYQRYDQEMAALGVVAEPAEQEEPVAESNEQATSATVETKEPAAVEKQKEKAKETPKEKAKETPKTSSASTNKEATQYLRVPLDLSLIHI